VDLVLLLVKRHLAEKMTPLPGMTVPLTAAGVNETEPSDLPNFEQELLSLVRFVCGCANVRRSLQLICIVVTSKPIATTVFQNKKYIFAPRPLHNRYDEIHRN
jgi:hypothetical protein